MTLASAGIRRPSLEDIEFFEDEHIYIHRPTGRRLPNVTSIMAASKLGFDPEGIEPVILERASARGRYVHGATVLVDENDLDEDAVPEKWRGYLDSYRAELAISGFRTTRAEYRVWHPQYWYSGTLDRIGFKKGKRIGRELKSGDMTEAEIQCAGYDTAYHFWHAEEPLEGWEIVRLFKDGRPALVTPVEDLPGAFQAFQAALYLDRYRQNRRR